MLVERHLVGAVPAPPPALPVLCLVDHDPVDPRAERRLAPKGPKRTEDSKKYLLRQIEGVVMVAQQVERQLVDHPLVRFDELCASLVVTGSTTLDEGCFVTADLRPSDSPS